MSSKPHAGPTLVPLDPEKVSALKALVERSGIAAAMRETGLGRLAISSIIGRGTAPAAQAALLERGLGAGAAPLAAARAAALAGRGRPFL